MDISPRRLGLKTSTAEAHHALDTMIGSFDTPASYARYLDGMARFRLPVEAWLAKAPPPAGFEDWQPGLYGEELRADLRDLGLDEPLDLPEFLPPDGAGRSDFSMSSKAQPSAPGFSPSGRKLWVLPTAMGPVIFLRRHGTFPVGARSRRVWRTCVCTTIGQLQLGPTPLSTMPVTPSKVP